MFFALTISNNADLLALKVVAPVPTSRVHDLALERVQSLDVGVAGLVQLSNSRDQEIRLDCVVGAEFRVLAAGDLDINLPLRTRIVPCGSLDRGVEANILVEVVFLGDSAEVGLCPLVSWSNRNSWVGNARGSLLGQGTRASSRGSARKNSCTRYSILCRIS